MKLEHSVVEILIIYPLFPNVNCSDRLINQKIDIRLCKRFTPKVQNYSRLKESLLQDTAIVPADDDSEKYFSLHELYDPSVH